MNCSAYGRGIASSVRLGRPGRDGAAHPTETCRHPGSRCCRLFPAGWRGRRGYSRSDEGNSGRLIDPKIHEYRGRIILGWGGEAEHAIEWGERGIRLSPFDPWITLTRHGIFLGHFLRGRYEEAATAVRRAIRNKPRFSISNSPDFFQPPAHSRRHLSCRLSQLELDRSAHLLLPHGRPDPPLSSGRANGVFPKCG